MHEPKTKKIKQELTESNEEIQNPELAASEIKQELDNSEDNGTEIGNDDVEN